MSFLSSTNRRHFLRRAVPTAIKGLLIAAIGVLAFSVGAFGSAHAKPAAERNVSFHGYHVRVPATWPIVRLAATPSACVRFDRHAVYLGAPTPQERCPARLIAAKTEGLLIEPLAATQGESGSVADPVAHQYVVTDAAAGVRVTATYGRNQALIERIIATAGTTVVTGTAGTASKSDTAGTASKGDTAGTASKGDTADRAAMAQRAPLAVPMIPTIRRLSAVVGARQPRAADNQVTEVPTGATSDIGPGFDTCSAPAQTTMDAWISHSPYRAVGIYIGGADRACAQPNLSADWVSHQANAGWHFVPLYVGPQAEWGEVTAPSRQGTNAADDAVLQARSLGFGQGNPLYYDMEAYPRRQSRRAVALLSAWTNELHRQGYASGVYSSSASAVADLVEHHTNAGYAKPDVIFDALWNGRADTRDPVIPAGDWAHHRRLHQYSGGSTHRYGGYSLNIDTDYLDVLVPPAGVLYGTAKLPLRQSQFLVH